MALLFLDGCDLYDNGDDADLDFRWAYNSGNQVRAIRYLNLDVEPLKNIGRPPGS